MRKVVSGYEPAALFRFFEEISAIPRASFHEEKIADYLCDFAKRRSLACFRDGLDNVLIVRPAAPGGEDLPPVLLQGHTDMVCEAEAGSTHDFAREGLALYVENGHLRAKGTTLGADNGVAVAAMLAVLDGVAPVRRPVECLFTTREEVGLLGAAAFDYSKIKARQMINLDTDEEGVAIVSCAGGVRGVLCAEFDRPVSGGEGILVKISGLSGGHSGMDIHRGLANANRLMARLLGEAARITELYLVSLDGGSKDNAIPRACTAKIMAADRRTAMAAIWSAAEAAKPLLQKTDPQFAFSCEAWEAEWQGFSAADTRRLLRLLLTLPDGALEMSADLAGLVETSANIGILKTEENHVVVRCSCRSSAESKLDALMGRISALSASEGFAATWDSRYPGWAYTSDSPLRALYRQHYSRLFGKEAAVTAIHAGLECGIVKNAIPDMDIISIGANVYHIHTPRESLDLASFARFWELLCAMLA